jgi:farnesyl diphosphate synthase
VIKKLYNDLQLERLYQEYEEKAVGQIKKLIAETDESDGLKKEVFESFLNKIYKRTK